jgi:hypothetical protein
MAAPARRDAGAAVPRNAFDELGDQQQPLPGGARTDPTGASAIRSIVHLVELEYGASWYFCPARWPTVDGFAPLAACWDAWDTLMRRRKLDRLTILQGTRLARAREQDYQSIVHELVQGAFE